MKKHTTMHPTESEMMGLMRDMAEKMETMEMPGDTDQEFAAMMIVHHQTAIDMAQMELKAGRDSMLKDLSKKIIEAQTEEIKQLQQWLREHKK